MYCLVYTEGKHKLNLNTTVESNLVGNFQCAESRPFILRSSRYFKLIRKKSSLADIFIFSSSKTLQSILNNQRNIRFRNETTSAD